MAHELTRTDNVLLTGKPAWHGLGTVIQDAPNPREAIKLAGLDWTVEQTDGVQGLWFRDGSDTPTRVSTDAAKINIRSDTGDVLGVVGPSWTPVQNAELAELAYALAAEGDDLKVETAGSIRGGRRVWLLVRGETIAAWGKGDNADNVEQYLMLGMGHDGTMAVVAQPTSVRVVCSNTFHYALGKGRASYRFWHCGDLTGKIDECKRAIGLWAEGGTDYAAQVHALGKAKMTRAALQEFWVDVYQRMVGESIPAPSDNKRDERKRDKATEAVAYMAQTFDRERDALKAPASAWMAFNAATAWAQHERQVRAKESERAEARTYSDLFGRGAQMKATAWDAALAAV